MPSGTAYSVTGAGAAVALADAAQSGTFGGWSLTETKGVQTLVEIFDDDGTQQAPTSLAVIDLAPNGVSTSSGPPQEGQSFTYGLYVQVSGGGVSGSVYAS